MKTHGEERTEDDSNSLWQSMLEWPWVMTMSRDDDLWKVEFITLNLSLAHLQYLEADYTPLVGLTDCLPRMAFKLYIA